MLIRVGNRRDFQGNGSRLPAGVVAVMTLAGAVVLTGCLDADALKESRSKAREEIKLAEIDLGEFRVSLPHQPGEPGAGLVDFHAFGEVTHGDHQATAKSLAECVPELRAALLLCIRGLSPEQLEDPQLADLRSSIADVVNRSLDKKLVQSVGFYRFSFTMP